MFAFMCVLFGFLSTICSACGTPVRVADFLRQAAMGRYDVPASASSVPVLRSESASPPPPPFCAAATEDEYCHVARQKTRERVRGMEKEDEKHYLFLHAASANCVECVSAWLARDADLAKGTMNTEWNAESFAIHGNASALLGFKWTTLFRMLFRQKSRVRGS